MATPKVMMWPGMPKSNFKLIGQYIRDTADALELRDWWFDLRHTPADDDCHGEITCTYGQKHANVKLCADFLEIKPERQRHTIVHELIHCHFDGSLRVLEKLLWEPRILSASNYVMLENAYRQQVEHGVDAMAMAIAKHFPLPDFGKA